jgi:hypothetical protein
MMEAAMDATQLNFETVNRYWSTEREAVNFFARHDGVELEFIVTKGALQSVNGSTSDFSEDVALQLFDDIEAVFLDAATRVWRAADESKPVYFINSDDLSRIV